MIKRVRHTLHCKRNLPLLVEMTYPKQQGTVHLIIEIKLPCLDLPIEDAIDAADDWYIVNVKERGYYRVNYDNDNWEQLVAVLNNDAQFQVISQRDAHEQSFYS